jgi:hypothetical protein
MPWPLSNRDYVFVRHKSQHEGSHVLISKGASHPDLAEQRFKQSASVVCASFLCLFLLVALCVWTCCAI